MRPFVFAYTLLSAALLALGCGSDDSSSAPLSPLGPPCTGVAECPSVVCDCVDGQKENLGQACIGGVCLTQDSCTRLLGFCGAHGGVVGGKGQPVPCPSEVSDCPAPAYCAANTNGTNCPPIYECRNGYCITDEVCAGAPPTCE